MSIVELVIIGVGLSMDAFAISITVGLSLGKTSLRQAVVPGLYFGISQAAMPIIGYFAGVLFSSKIIAFDHWVAFVLLAFIGGKMVKDSFGNDEAAAEGNATSESKLSFKMMFPLAIATSIDALAVGVSFAFLHVQIWIAASIIGVTTFLLSAIGTKVGSIFGARWKSKAELVGGIILILMGTKILLEHLGIITL
ncbi:MAG: manganese efflux pump MntP family protein [Clostridiales Family XIII bacterium]|jgi:putative Mn2+ efflux pump MntP|nr:manganese efflux pump MntP family protein [Clostridiales Family XIII bacterium]